jgi:methionyl-tRNA formyltransferase
MSLRVVFAGTPQFSVSALAAIAARHTVVGVLTQPDRPAGRGRSLTASPVKEFALAQGLPLLQPLTLRGDAPDTRAALAQLRAWQADVMVVVAYGLLLPQAVLDLPRHGCLNIHASLLPRWRGAAPIQRAILAGDTESGVTIMQMDAGLDTGAMLHAARVPITPTMTSVGLHDALASLGAQLIVQTLDDVAAGQLAPRAQPAAGVTYAEKLSKAEAAIDWHQPVAQIDRQIRAFNPWPAAQAQYLGEPVKLLQSCVLPGAAAPAVLPGTLLGLQDGVLVVAGSDGLLGVVELQRAGRRKVGARDFANAEQLATAVTPRIFE